jgi:hypothetical protein
MYLALDRNNLSAAVKMIVALLVPQNAGQFVE